MNKETFDIVGFIEEFKGISVIKDSVMAMAYYIYDGNVFSDTQLWFYEVADMED